jgi:hypothetical protein
MSQTKTVVLTKEAASDLITGGMLPPKKRNRTAKRSSGMDGSTTVIKLGHTGGELPPPPPAQTSPSKPVGPVISTPPSSTTPAATPASPSTTGGDHKVVKVELKKKTTAKKVQLQPKKVDQPKTVLHSKKTLKKPRKITLGISSMRRRLTRAKKAQSRVKEMPLDQLKKLLIDKKLIKPTSTAPESILRQIAADAQIVADKSL